MAHTMTPKGGFQHNDTEYRARRQQDEERTRIIEAFMDNVYARNRYNIERVNDAELQKKGVDIIHTKNGASRNVDEKYAITYFNKDLRTFSFELYSRNNIDCNGWFISDNVITDDYAILWFKADDEFTTVTEYDLCIIPKQSIMKLARKAGYYDGIVEDFLYYWENGQYLTPDTNYYELGEDKGYRRYLRLKFGCKLVQSAGLHEQPINIVIPKDELIKLATYRFRGIPKKK